MKKFLSVLLVVVLTASICISGTMAYLQEDDSDVNVMTLGNVSIEQIEQERNAAGELVPFTQAKPAYPVVGPIEWAAEGVAVNGTEYKVFTGDLKNVVDKIITVNNTGKSDAYVRTIVAIEAPEKDPNDLIHFNYNDTGVKVENSFVTEIDGVDYYIVTFVYTEALAPGKKSAPSLMQVFLDSKATNEDCAKFGESWEILVVSQAVQTNGFADAKTALDTAFGDITASSHPWSNTIFVQANDAAELKNALTSSKDVVVNTDIVEIDGNAFNGNGTEVTLAGVGDGAYGYLSFNPGANKDAEVSDIKVTGSGFVEVGHYGQTGGKYTVEGLTVEDMNATLTAVNGTDKIAAAFAHYGTATLTDCVMSGTTTAVDGYTAYDAGFVNKTVTTIERGKYESIYVFNHASVTIKNAKIDRIDSSAVSIKGGTGKLIIGADSEIGIINITDVVHNGASLTPALTIEDGAKVGAIVYKNVTYTVDAWKTANP